VTAGTVELASARDPLGVYLRLEDGTLLRIRPIRPSDKPLLAAGLERLSAPSVQRRFLSPKPRFSAAELRYLTEVDGHDHVAHVAELPNDPSRLLAVGRWVRLPDEPEAAEVAILVADDWQRRGIGSLLSTVLADDARLRGIRRFTATMQADNVPAHRLMRKLTDRLERRSGGAGIDELVLELAA
jgi:GNAT superfamily N-acetyltransferase